VTSPTSDPSSEPDARGSAADKASEEIAIHGIAHGGAGVGRVVEGAAAEDGAERQRGPVWFVHGALPGEVVVASARKRAKRHVEAELVEIRTAAQIRTTPPCPFAEPRPDPGPACGGCQWQHVDDAAQPELKREVAASQLRRLPLEVANVVPSPRSVGYRRRARLHYRVRPASDGAPATLELGFFGRNSHAVADVDRCMVLEPALDRALQRIRTLADVLPEQGEVHGLTDGVRTVLGLPGVRPSDEIVAALEAMLDDELVGVTIRGGRQRKTVGVAALAIDGSPPSETVPGLPALVAGPFVFTQAQAEQNEALVRHVATAAKAGGRKVLELFAGAGNFTRALAADAEGVWASDDDREAILRLRELAEGTGLPIRARKDTAHAVLGRLARDGRTYDVIVLDPPRTGLGRETAALVARVAARRVVYVSCDPATLARDLEVLFADGFEAVDVRVFDMMPMTAEVEIVATLRRRGPRVDHTPPHLRDQTRGGSAADGGRKGGTR